MATGGGYVAYRQWRQDVVIKRNMAIRDVVREMYGRLRTNRFLYDVEYETKWYDDKFHNSEKEGEVDQVMYDLNYVCYILREGVIKKGELNMVQYVLYRCLRNKQVQEYLAFTNNFAQRQGLECPFAELIRFGLTNNLLDEKTFNR